MKRLKQNALVLPAVATLVVLADQVTKHLVATRLVEGQSWDIVPWLAPVFRVTYTTNTGAAFGLFPELGGVLVFVAVVVIVAMVVYYWRLPSGQWLMRAALGLQLGGATGNLLDRLRRGSVIDFIDLNFWPLREWPVSNLADISIVTGVSLLALLLLWEERRERRGQQVTVDG